MNVKNSGFGLIELVIVIVIVAILAAIAIPRFINTQSDARQADTNSVAAALNAAAAANHALGKAFSNKKVTVSNCTNVVSALPAGTPLPAGYTINPQAVSAGSSVTCTVMNPDGTTTATFIAWGVS